MRASIRSRGYALRVARWSVVRRQIPPSGVAADPHNPGDPGRTEAVVRQRLENDTPKPTSFYAVVRVG